MAMRDSRLSRAAAIGVAIACGSATAFCGRYADRKAPDVDPGAYQRSGVPDVARSQTLSLIEQVRPDRPAPLFLFTDPGRDPDDLVALVACHALENQGVVELRAVVTTLGSRATREKRAQLTKSVLDMLGMSDAAVGVGRPYGSTGTDSATRRDGTAEDMALADHETFLDTPLLDARSVVEADGQALLRRELNRVPNRSAILLVNAGMTDLAHLLRESPELLRRKVRSVVIMGGVQKPVGPVGVVADTTAYNNTTDQYSANSVYIDIQKNRIPLVVVTREAAYAAPVAPSFYGQLSLTGNSVGVALEEQQKQSINNLWLEVRGKPTSERLNARWFFRTFTDLRLNSVADEDTLSRLVKASASSDTFSEIWSLVRRLNLYDVLSLLAASPGVSKVLFRPECPLGDCEGVALVGGDAILDPQLLRDTVTTLAVLGLSVAPQKQVRDN